MNPYETLGVSKTASQNEIKMAYRKLAKKFHPDFNPGNKEAEQKFKEANAAYELIGTPEARKKFDEGPPKMDPGFWEDFLRKQGGGQGRYYYSTQGDPNARYSFQFGGGEDDLFSSLFGQAQGFQRRGHGPGAGNFRGGPDIGEAPFGEPVQETYLLEIELRDAVLGAERELSLPTGRKLRVKIPPGVKEGGKLRFAAKEKQQSDVYVELRVKPNEKFRREGDDVESDLDIPLAVAISGGEIHAPTLDGSVLLKIPKGVNTGTKLRVRGKGVPGKGDQLVRLRVVLPETIDPELEAWAKKHFDGPRRAS